MQTAVAISLWQPGASAVAHGRKRLETRGWRFPPAYLGKQVAIHAARRWSPALRAYAESLRADGIDLGFEGVPPLGAIVGVATLADCIPTEALFGTDPTAPVLSEDGPNTWREFRMDDQRPGRFAWLLTDAVALSDPIPLRGYQGFWRLDESTSDVLDDELRREMIRSS